MGRNGTALTHPPLPQAYAAFRPLDVAHGDIFLSHGGNLAKPTQLGNRKLLRAIPDAMVAAKLRTKPKSQYSFHRRLTNSKYMLNQRLPQNPLLPFALHRCSGNFVPGCRRYAWRRERARSITRSPYRVARSGSSFLRSCAEPFADKPRTLGD